MSTDTIAVAASLAPQRARVLRRPFLTARWQLLAMLNWEIDPRVLEPLVPPGCELDFHCGKTFVSLVGFLFLDTRLLGWPVPGHRNFEEVNLRFYVRREGARGLHRGVAFVKEIVPRWAIARLARLCYNEPYVALPMAHEVTGPAAELGSARGQETGNRRQERECRGKVGYRWRFDGRWNSVEVEYAGDKLPLVPGSLEEFIAEHYFGYCRQCSGCTVEYQVEHLPWNVWPVTAARIDANVEALYGSQFAPVLLQSPTTSFLADGSAVAVMRPTRLP